jgi:hypothetical protein
MPYERAHRASHQTFTLRGPEVGKWRYLLVLVDEMNGSDPNPLRSFTVAEEK